MEKQQTLSMPSLLLPFPLNSFCRLVASSHYFLPVNHLFLSLFTVPVIWVHAKSIPKVCYIIAMVILSSYVVMVNTLYIPVKHYVTRYYSFHNTSFHNFPSHNPLSHISPIQLPPTSGIWYALDVVFSDSTFS